MINFHLIIAFNNYIKFYGETTKKLKCENS